MHACTHTHTHTHTHTLWNMRTVSHRTIYIREWLITSSDTSFCSVIFLGLGEKWFCLTKFGVKKIHNWLCDKIRIKYMSVLRHPRKQPSSYLLWGPRINLLYILVHSHHHQIISVCLLHVNAKMLAYIYYICSSFIYCA
jgi:hypothetical protein